MFDPSEYGQVFAQIGSGGSGTYVDVKGVTQDFEQLQTSYTPMLADAAVNTSEPYLARTMGQEWDFQFAYAGATGYTVRVVARRIDGTWEPIQTVRSDTGLLGKEHAVTTSDASLLLQTDSVYIREQARVEVKAAGSPNASDTVVSYCRAM